MCAKLNIGFSKQDFKKTGIVLRAELDVIFSHIFVGELILENTRHQGLGKPKLTVVSYGAYKEMYPCLVTEFLMMVNNLNEKEFINYRFLPCESEEEVHTQLKTLTQNQSKENAEYLGEVLDDLLTKYYTDKK